MGGEVNSILVLLVGLLFQAAPQFEVVSIKPNTNGPGPSIINMPPTGRANLTNVTVRMMLRTAYRYQDYQIIGGPGWVNTDQFDIQARPAPDYQPETYAPCFGADCPFSKVQIMMQGLLADRFQLKTHRETRELLVYELTIGKSGFKLKEVAAPPQRGAGTPPPPPPPPPAPGTPPPNDPSKLPIAPPGAMMNFPFGLSASAVQFGVLVSALSQILGRPVIDKTGIKGYYDFRMAYSREGIPNAGILPPPGNPDGPGAGAPIASDPAPSIFTALQEQIGLKLDSTKGPVQIMVIDSVQKPAEN